MIWKKIDHFTGEPYKKNPKSGAWYIVDYICGNLRISNMDGYWLLTKGFEKLGRFKALKAAKAFAETILDIAE